MGDWTSYLMCQDIFVIIFPGAVEDNNVNVKRLNKLI